MSATKTTFTLFSAEGITFCASGTTLANALKRASSETNGYTIIAAVAADCVVTPAPGKLTALIVSHSGGAPR